MVYQLDKAKENLPRRGLFKHTTLAACIMALTSTPSFAQEDAADLEEVIVTGTRANLQNAQDIKREADTFVDSISAEDIGSLPDRSVLEAMQRMPGVSIERFAGPDDPDHFSVEGSGAVVRGMTATRSEFNGRDSFSASSGRGLSFQDVSPELMGGVDVYKNQTADMIEGGIGGTVSLRTRKPFDSDDRVIAISGDASYGDLAQEWTPTISGLFSDRWETSAGEFGLLVNYARSELVGESHGIQSDAFVEYYARDLAGAEAFVGLDGEGRVQIPNASNLLMKTDERFRQGGAVSIQWESPNDDILATFEYIRSEANLAWNERAVKYQGGYNDINRRETRPRDGTTFTFDEDGLFQSGFLTLGNEQDGGWRVNDVNADHIPHAWTSPGFSQFGHKTQMDSRVNETDSLVEDFALNVVWNVTENLELEADIQYIQAESRNDDLAIHANTYAAQKYDLTGDTPSLELVDPFFGVRDENPSDFATGFPGFSGDPAGDTNYFQDPNSYYWRSAMDHYQRSEGNSASARLDATYHFEDTGIVRSVKAGVRYSKREQTVRDTDYNWGAISPEWGSEPLAWLADVETQQDAYEVVDWSNFMHGGVVDISGDGTLHANEMYIRALMGANPSREQYRTDGNDWVSQADQPGVDSEFGLFEPNEINLTEETNKAFYVRLDFGSDDSDLRYSGNVGLRYFKLDRTTTGFVSFPDLVPNDAAPSSLSLPLDPAAVLANLQAQVDNGDFATLSDAIDADVNDWAGDRVNYIPNDQREFGDNSSEVLDAVTETSMWLPSFNIKVELTDDLIARFGVAKAVALPDIGDVKNNLSLGDRSIVELKLPPSGPDGMPLPEETLTQAAYVTAFEGSGGNPYLEPMESVQFDVSLEWYFGAASSVTGTVFHKNLSNLFVQGASLQSVTNPNSGITMPADVISTRNGGKAKMDGFELAYQQFFDKLPEPWDGLGVQASYTYISASGVPNNEADVENEGWLGADAEDTGIRVELDSVPLQGQSDETFNLIGMYEKYGWSARVAYNWRSRYLLTTRDVISKAPLWYDDHGQVDASLFYDINDNVTVGVQGTNLTNSQSDTLMILNDELLETGRSWFVSDRRVALVVRAQF